MIGTILFEVVARYAFNSPTIWSLETSTMLYATCVIGAGAYTLLHGAHVRMDAFYSRWPKRVKAIVDVCTFPTLLAFCGVLLYKASIEGWQSCVTWEHATTAWGPPIYPIKIMLTVAALLILLQGIANFIRDLTLAITGKELK